MHRTIAFSGVWCDLEWGVNEGTSVMMKQGLDRGAGSLGAWIFAFDVQANCIDGSF